MSKYRTALNILDNLEISVFLISYANFI